MENKYVGSIFGYVDYRLEKNNDSGFTLIELLIVIAIIGILATLLMANFIGVQQRARDAQRKHDLRQIQDALELYRADNGSYPPSGAGAVNDLINCPSPPATPTYFGNAPACTMATVYMQKIPQDPPGDFLSTSNYRYASPGNSYVLVACLENKKDSQITSCSSLSGYARSICTMMVGSCGSTQYILTNP